MSTRKHKVKKGDCEPKVVHQVMVQDAEYQSLLLECKANGFATVFDRVGKGARVELGSDGESLFETESKRQVLGQTEALQGGAPSCPRSNWGKLTTSGYRVVAQDGPVALLRNNLTGKIVFYSGSTDEITVLH